MWPLQAAFEQNMYAITYVDWILVAVRAFYELPTISVQTLLSHFGLYLFVVMGTVFWIMFSHILELWSYHPSLIFIDLYSSVFMLKFSRTFPRACLLAFAICTSTSFSCCYSDKTSAHVSEQYINMGTLFVLCIFTILFYLYFVFRLILCLET